jgi:hypothetical protein
MMTEHNKMILEKITVRGQKRAPVPFFPPKITQGMASE